MYCSHCETRGRTKNFCYILHPELCHTPTTKAAKVTTSNQPHHHLLHCQKRSIHSSEAYDLEHHHLHHRLLLLPWIEAKELELEGKTASAMGKHMVVHGQKKTDVIAKSIEKIKETSTDVWQGTQLLGIDVAAAMVLLKRSVTGDELTEKEKKALRRTLTDLASVLPIGFLMLLPVTAVGHAAMLAAIQRYVPALIPSTYGPERLDLLRQLEKVKELETAEMTSEEMTEAIGSPSSSSSSNSQ